MPQEKIKPVWTNNSYKFGYCHAHCVIELVRRCVCMSCHLAVQVAFAVVNLLVHSFFLGPSGLTALPGMSRLRYISAMDMAWQVRG